LSRLTQIAPPSTRFVSLGAEVRLGLPSHPASRRRSCLRLGVHTTSSSKGLPPPINRPCRAYSRRAYGGVQVTDLVVRLAWPPGPAPLAARGLRPCSRGPSRRPAVDRQEVRRHAITVSKPVTDNGPRTPRPDTIPLPAVETTLHQGYGPTTSTDSEQTGETSRRGTCCCGVADRARPDKTRCHACADHPRTRRMARGKCTPVPTSDSGAKPGWNDSVNRAVDWTPSR
jgi:hypothetical protein